MAIIDNKKRLMFTSGDDLYFFTYNILIVLDVLNCTDGKVFKDYRKLPFVVDAISDNHFLNILMRNDFGRVKNPTDRKHLVASFTNCKIKTSEYLKLLFSLEKKGFISLSSKVNNQIDVTLNKQSIPKDFLKAEIFKNERDNASTLKKEVKQMSILNFETLIDRLYTSGTGQKWAV